MSAEHEMLSMFFEEWTKEFTRALEMFTGDKAEVACEPASAEEIVPERLVPFTWWKHVFQGTGSFAVWVGAPEESWRGLGSTMAASADQAREAFLEMLAQAQQGTAAVISAGLAKPLRCQDVEDCEAPALELSGVRRIGIKLRGTALPPLLLSVEACAAQVIGMGASGEMIPSGRPKGIPGEFQPEGGSQMLGRLMDIDLPLSVALGRAVLPVRDILKMTPGALVELDRDVGEYVDVLVHGTVVARGEVVSIKGNYGVRIKEIISREDRLALQKQA
jgi:flagellar motor switch protein FliN/FliY